MRKSMTAGGQTTGYTYDSLHRLTQVSGSGGSVGYGYDLAGRPTTITMANKYEDFVNGLTGLSVSSLNNVALLVC